MPDFIYYLFGAFLYSMSQKFRERKRREWDKQSDIYRVYEVGMWIIIPVFTLIFVLMAVLNP